MSVEIIPSQNKLQDEYWWRKAITFGGFDVGKRGNPSHCSVFAISEANIDGDGVEKPEDETIVMIHQKFLDNWEYTRQVDYLTSLINYFDIRKLYYDNTRGELEERSLPRECIPIILSNRTGPRAKGKIELATNFAKLVEQKRMILLDDDRFISQITCVTGDLQAPNTPRGHGDSFISIMLAVGVFYDYYASDRRMGTSSIGNIQGIVDSSEKNNMSSADIMEIKKDPYKDKCMICGGKEFNEMPDGIKKICTKCYTVW